MEMQLKSIRLPETDLANMAFRPRAAKVQILTAWLRPKQIGGSYEPTRRSIGEAADVSLPLLPDLGRTSLAQLERLVIRECKGNDEYVRMNLPIVKSIRQFMTENEAEADFLDELPLTLYPNLQYSFWSPMLVRYNGKARVVFLDMRKSGGLKLGLSFCFSAMNERFRVLSPDYQLVGSEVWRFANNPDRSIVVIEDTFDHIPYDAILADVEETYAILAELRRSESGPFPTTDFGPLFG